VPKSQFRIVLADSAPYCAARECIGSLKDALKAAGVEQMKRSPKRGNLPRLPDRDEHNRRPEEGLKLTEQRIDSTLIQ
jgi:hypothetical protein